MPRARKNGFEPIREIIEHLETSRVAVIGCGCFFHANSRTAIRHSQNATPDFHSKLCPAVTTTWFRASSEMLATMTGMGVGCVGQSRKTLQNAGVGAQKNLRCDKVLGWLVEIGALVRAAPLLKVASSVRCPTQVLQSSHSVP